MKSVFKKISGLDEVTKASLGYSISAIAQKGISFFTVPIFTRIMSISQYGIYSIYASWVSIFTILATLELHTCAYINGLAKLKEKKDKDELAISLLSLSIITTLVLLIIYLSIRKYICQYVGMSTKMVLLMFVEIIFIPATQFWMLKQRYSYKYIRLMFFSLSQVILNFVLGYFLVRYAKEERQAFARVTAIVIVQVVYGTCMYFYFFNQSKSFLSTRYWKKGLELHIPLLPHRMSLTVLALSDRLMIQHYIGDAAAALYSVAYSASMTINIIKLSIIESLTPWIYESLKKNDYSAIRSRTTYVLLFVVGMIFLFILFAPEIIVIVGSKKYSEALCVIPPVTASVYFTFLFNLFSTIEQYFEKTKGIMIASVIASTTNIILNLFFLKKYGYIAAGYTTFVSYIMLSILHYCFMNKAIKKEESIKSANCIFNMFFIVLFALIIIILSTSISFFYKYNILRYAIIMLILCSFMIYRKRIFSILRKKK